MLCSMLGVPVLLTDDLAARDATKVLGLTPVGSLGIIARACQMGRITTDEAERRLLDLASRKQPVRDPCDCGVGDRTAPNRQPGRLRSASRRKAVGGPYDRRRLAGTMPRARADPGLGYPMSPTDVYEILDRIRQLPAEDRLLLNDLLAEQEAVEWREEAAAARQVAREKGIGQAAIDRAVHAVRHDL